MRLDKNKISIELKKEMDLQGINAENLCKHMNKQSVYSVLQMGKFKNKDYRISTLIRVCELLKINNI